MMNFFMELPAIVFLPAGWVLLVMLEASILYVFFRKKFRWLIQMILLSAGLIIFALWIFSVNPQPHEGEFMRTVEKNGAFLFQVARRKYVNDKTGDTVVMQGICHIGEKELYDEMNCYFTDFNCILYEGVAHKIEKKDGKKKKEDVPEKDHNQGNSGSMTPLRDEYEELAIALGLTTQRKSMIVDGNWQWCDVTVEDIIEEARNKGIKSNIESKETFASEIFEKGKERSKSGFYEILRSSGSIKQQALITGFYFTSGFDMRRLKRMASDQASHNKDCLSPSNSNLEYLIVDFRNRKAIHKLKLYLLNPEYQHVALFYGAAHLTGMQKMLFEEGFKAEGEKQWVTVFRY